MMTRFRGSTQWIASLAYMDPDADNINGLLFVGSFDNKIRVYDPLTPEPKETYTGHGQTVCALAVNNKTQTLVSGSWDKTIKVWRGAWGKIERKCTKTISDVHQGSVLDILLLDDDSMISACADKIIRLINPAGNVVRQFLGDLYFLLKILTNVRSYRCRARFGIIR